MKKLTAAFTALLSPKSSEFWTAITAVVGAVGSKTGWIPADLWNHYGPPLITYVAARFVSKAAKA